MQSDEYNANIYPPPGVIRRTAARVTYSLTAPDSKEGGELILPDGNEFSRPDQVMNEIRALSAPIATLEPNYWRLDGTFVLPVAPESSNVEVGFWSSEMSAPEISEWNYRLDGSWKLGKKPFATLTGYEAFKEPLVIERVFENVQTFSALGISFDAQTDNYCTDFEVFFYDAYNGLVYSEHITDNYSAYRRTEKAGEDILRVVIKLYKTNLSRRYARIAEIDFGIMLEFDDHDISSLSMVSEADPSGRTFPFPEFRLTIFNLNRFDVLDSRRYIQARQRFEYRHGLVLPDGSVEFVDCGTYFLSNSRVSDSTVEFTARGRTALLENSVYFDSSFQEFTIGQLVSRIIPQARITLNSPRITGYFGNVDYRRVLTMLSELSCCLVYEDVNNIIQFDDILSKTPPIKFEWNYLLNGSWQLGEKPFAEKIRLIDSINYNNAYHAPKVNQGDDNFNAINLMEYTVSTETRQISKTRQQPGEITVYFSAPVVGELTFELPPGYELENVIIYTMYMTATLTGTGSAELIIYGESVTLTKSEILYKAPWHTGREPDNPYKIDLPCMIRTENFEVFRDWFLARRFAMLNKHLTCDINWRQNPAARTADLINVQLRKDGGNIDMAIVKQELTYNGALSGNTKSISEIVMR